VRFQDRRLTVAKAYLAQHHEYSEKSAASLWLGLQIYRQAGNASDADAFARRLLDEFPDSSEASAYIAQSN